MGLEKGEFAPVYVSVGKCMPHPSPLPMRPEYVHRQVSGLAGDLLCGQDTAVERPIFPFDKVDNEEASQLLCVLPHSETYNVPYEGVRHYHTPVAQCKTCRPYHRYALVRLSLWTTKT